MKNAYRDADVSGVGPPSPSSHSSRTRSYILLGLLVPFSLLTYLAVSSGSPGDVRDRPVILTTLATVSGPFVGAIARRGQSCCLAFSIGLAEVCGPFLALGVLAQIVPLPFTRGQRAVRLVLWTVGWAIWLLGGLASFLHALE